jgi:uncharacterized protein YjiK
MTLAPGSSPQGTEFYDTEGIAYVGGGRFVLAEERYRQIDRFTYVPGSTLTRGDVQTGIDFAAGTATNGSPTTQSSTNLFDPALAGLADFSDVFALSNLSTLTGADASHLLVLSQESGRIVNIDRSGNVSSALTIVSDPGNPLSVPDQTHEGVVMDDDGRLYVVSEDGGGDIGHPQHRPVHQGRHRARLRDQDELRRQRRRRRPERRSDPGRDQRSIRARDHRRRGRGRLAAVADRLRGVAVEQR